MIDIANCKQTAIFLHRPFLGKCIVKTILKEGSKSVIALYLYKKCVGCDNESYLLDLTDFNLNKLKLSYLSLPSWTDSRYRKHLGQSPSSLK